MSLTPNTRFGSYQIAESIGSGGMGEVYKATDRNLKREVAIKVLPESFVHDPDRLARFQREAEVLASLNHFNIAQVYGLEQGLGQTGLVMELVDGPTLADRLKQGPIEIDEALEIAQQIAAALEAAHERGIVHRDLKPANVKLRPDGVVKVLDFGLAKTVDHPASSADGAAPALTETGMILGTAAYMSPEQARGRPVDKRTDIWAFGAVLYEMLSGQPPFFGEDPTDTVASVLRSDPDWSALPDLPPLLEVFLKLCLEKDPRNRIRDIADARLALTNKYGVMRSPSDQIHVDPARERRNHVLWAASAVLSLLIGASGVYTYLNTRPVGAAMSDRQVTFRQLTFRQGTVGNARFASDGEVIVYSAAWDGGPYELYNTRIDSFQSRPLDFLPPADLLALSGDNRAALAQSRPAADGWQPRGPLAIVNLSGGGARVVDDHIVSADWGTDGQLAAVVRFVDGEMQVEFPIGTVVYRGNVIGNVRVSPDGQRICFAALWDELYQSERSGPARRIASDLPRIEDCAWSPEGDEIWFSYAVTGGTYSNLEAITPDGEQRRVLAALPAFGRLLDVSPSGSVLAAIGSLRFTVRGAPSADAPVRDLSVFDATRIVQLNAAGTNLLLQDSSTGARERGTLFTRPIDGSAPVQQSDAAGFALSPDGAWIAVLGDGSTYTTRSSMITLIPTGAGEPSTIELPVEVEYGAWNQLGTNVWDLRNPEFSDDGERLLLPRAREKSGSPRAYVHDFAEGWTRPVTPAGVTGPFVLSPDGQFVAGQEPDGLYVYSVDSGERRRLPGERDPGMLARWSEDQQSVYVVEQEGTTASIYERNLETGERTLARRIGAPDPAGVARFDVWVARDGEAFAYSLARVSQDLFLLKNVN
jgi:hypothetical protein